MDLSRTSDLLILSRFSKSPFTSNGDAPDLRLSTSSLSTSNSDAEKLARLGRRQRPGTQQKSTPGALSQSPFACDAEDAKMYINYTISEDRSGSMEEVMAQRLKALSGRDKGPEQPTWLQCRQECCKESWHVDGRSLLQHVYRSHILALATFEDPHESRCPWGGCQLSFVNTSSLRTHVFHHIKPKAYSIPDYECRVCNDKFANLEEEVRHAADAHKHVVPDFTLSSMLDVRKGLRILSPKTTVLIRRCYAECSGSKISMVRWPYSPLKRCVFFRLLICLADVTLCEDGAEATQQFKEDFDVRSSFHLSISY
jgi:hypothetical protein